MTETQREAEQRANVVTICKIYDGYCVDMIGYPILYVFASQMEAEQFADTVRQRLDILTTATYQRGLRDAAKVMCLYCNAPDEWGPMTNSGYHACKYTVPTLRRCKATAIYAELTRLAEG